MRRNDVKLSFTGFVTRLWCKYEIFLFFRFCSRASGEVFFYGLLRRRFYSCGEFLNCSSYATCGKYLPFGREILQFGKFLVTTPFFWDIFLQFILRVHFYEKSFDFSLK